MTAHPTASTGRSGSGGDGSSSDPSDAGSNPWSGSGQGPGTDPGGGSARAYWRGIRTVVGLEIRQRLRARGWLILLGIWFFVIAVVFVLAAMATGMVPGGGAVLFDLVVFFVLFFGLLVAPALSANAVNGDRAGGTLAILQITLLSPGQILAGKFLASWLASLGFLIAGAPFIIGALAFGGVNFAVAAVSLLMLAFELGVVCAIGVGISTLANRPLFSIVVTYMVVAGLAIGTLVGFGLSTTLTKDTVDASYPVYQEGPPSPTGPSYTCSRDRELTEVYRTDRVAWMLAANPFVIVADAVPYAAPFPELAYLDGQEPQARGLMATISDLVRSAQAGPEYSTPCLTGVNTEANAPDQMPQWPLGVGLQLVLAGGLVFLARRRLRTPVAKLSKGTRIA